MGRTVLFGLGNRLRGDDAIGLEVAREVAVGRPDLEVVEHEREPIDLIELWSDAVEAIVVDAVAGSSPGRVHRFAAGDGVAWERRTPASSHALHLGQVIDLARALGRLPPRLELIAIEGSGFGTGTEPSTEVRAAGRLVASELISSVATTEAPG
jgi:hydrogenase maturation protease